MKLAPVFLVASLAANAALAGLLLVRRSDPSATVARAAVAPRPVEVAKPEEPGPIGREFLTLTAEQLRDRLRASDLPRSVVDELVKARIDARVQAREHELVALAMKSAPLWKLVSMTYNRLAILTPAERKELRDLESEARDETLRLLGPAVLDPSGRIAAKYGFVSPEKAVQLEALEADYDSLAEQVKDETRNLKTPADKDREKLVKAEKDKDLAALLTPDEREAFELRASATAKNTSFQARVAAFQPTEEEYRALFALQKTVDESGAQSARPTGFPALGRPAPGTPPITMTMISGGNAAPADADVRAALGDARYADWQLASQPYYQSLFKLATAGSVSPDIAKRLGTAVSDTLDASWRIADDTTISGPQKQTAVTDLATKLRAQLDNGLGAGATDVLLKNAQWFDALSKGSAVMVRGSMTAFRPVDPPPRPAAPGR